MSDDETLPAPRPRRPRPKDDSAKKSARAANATDSVAVFASAGPHDPPTTALAVPPLDALRRPLLASSVAAAVGLAIVGTSAHALGPWVLSAGVFGLVASIHRLGRLGPA